MTICYMTSCLTSSAPVLFKSEKRAFRPYSKYSWVDLFRNNTNAAHLSSDSVGCDDGMKYNGVKCAVVQNADDFNDTVRALKSRDRFPKKWLGQHYMVNNKVNADVVNAAQINPGDIVLEVGPGTGSLTNVLVQAGAYVIAVEKDPDMASLVVERFASSGQVQVIKEDFLKLHLRRVMSELLKESHAGLDCKLAKVVSNLPFNITTDVIKRLLPMGDIFSQAVLLLQDEAACRLVDRAPSSHDYRPISLMVNYYSVPEYKFRVPRINFFPQPRVDAAVVCFKIKDATEYPLVTSTKAFFSMINSAFNGKRKMLRNSLQHLFSSDDVQAALISVGLPATARPETLSLDQFVSFYNTVSSMSTISDPQAAVFDMDQLLLHDSQDTKQDSLHEIN